MDCLFQPNRRKTDTPNNDAHGASAMDETLANINAVLAEHSHQINTLVAANRALERSIQVLKKDTSWTYSAPDIPRSHWIETGHDEDYADVLEEFLSNIQIVVEGIRNESRDSVYHCLVGNNTGTAIMHDDALIPHFAELADAIQVSSTNVELGMRKMTITRQVMIVAT